MTSYRSSRMTPRQAAGLFAVGAVLAAAVAGHAHAQASASSHGSRAARAAIAYARHQLGKPYCWGGTGPSCYDCSGLTMEAWQAAGETIPRTSQEQWAYLPHVSHLEPGDLVFYAGADGTVTDPGHVVLYIGHGDVIQAYGTGYPVMRTPLADVQAGGLTGYAEVR